MRRRYKVSPINSIGRLGRLYFLNGKWIGLDNNAPRPKAWQISVNKWETVETPEGKRMDLDLVVRLIDPDGHVYREAWVSDSLSRNFKGRLWGAYWGIGRRRNHDADVRVFVRAYWPEILRRDYFRSVASPEVRATVWAVQNVPEAVWDQSQIGS